MPAPELPEICPHCQSPMLPEGDGRRCSVCHHALRACPDCGGLMVKRVEPPAGLGIGSEGLPLEQCAVQWVCGSPGCGLWLDAEP